MFPSNLYIDSREENSFNILMEIYIFTNKLENHPLQEKLLQFPSIHP